MGTGNGLFRYDGSRFQCFGQEEGLPNASIRRLWESAGGTLWVVTGRGLARRAGRGFEPVAVGGAMMSTDLKSVTSAPDGRLYVSSDRGLFTARPVTPGSRPAFYLVDSAQPEPVDGVLADADGSVWYSSNLKLHHLDQGSVTTFGKEAGLPADHWGAMLRTRDGALWARGAQHLYVLPAGATRFVARDDNLPQSSNTLLSMIEDRSGMVLVATDSGVACWRNGGWQLIGRIQGLESETTTAVLQDREGSIWVGMWGAGVARWTGYSEWTSWTTADGLASDLVWAIRRQPSGSVWVGTDRGLAELKDGVVERLISRKEGLAGDNVKGLATGPDGALWVACLPGGVSRIDARTDAIKTYGAADGLADDRVIAIHIDGDNRLWASTQEGLYRSTNLGPHMRFERQTPPGSGARATFFRFLGDREGRVWVGSSGGLYRWDHGQWTRFTTQDGLKVNGVSNVAETGDGAIWFSYREPVGMSRMTMAGGKTRLDHFTTKEGLPTNYIMFLGVDAQRRLWAGSDSGVGVREGDTWRIYTHDDGMVWDDCAANSFWSEPDGTVWIGTLKGMSRFRSNGHETETQPPPVVVTAVTFGERAVDPAAQLQVSYRDHDFLVHFAGLSFVSERNMQFRLRLSGVDEDWVTTSLREARYSGLPAGSYRFDVEARIPGGDWSASPASISFRIVPPWWQTWTFRVLAALLLAALIVAIVRARLRQMANERRRLEAAVRERTSELECQKDLVETQKEEIEDLLRRSEEVSRLKSEFLANMSHEIRTPMNGVLGMTQLVLHTTLDQEQREYMNTVRESAEALLVVINDVLDFSKIEAGKMELRHDAFEIRKCVSDALQMFTWKAGEKGIQLLQKVAEDVPAMLVGDPDRIRQILLNLVGNSIKFTERGNITVEISVAGGGKELLYSVADTGAGIPYDKQSMIFDAFAQADGSAKRRNGGTGLGLAICTKLVQLMDGRIWVESTPGAGSKFAFQAPLVKSEQRVTAGGAAPGLAGLSAQGLRPMSILLAEDNVVNQKLVHRVLERLGHAVTLVENGREAVEAAGRAAFDVVLMDVQMPEMDGYEATRRIRERETAAGVHTPIVALTAHAMTGDRDECLAAGMDDYLSKPIQLDKLAELLGRVAAAHPVSTP